MIKGTSVMQQHNLGTQHLHEILLFFPVKDTKKCKNVSISALVVLRNVMLIPFEGKAHMSLENTSKTWLETSCK